jgi:acetoacetate decarboxylase
MCTLRYPEVRQRAPLLELVVLRVAFVVIGVRRPPTASSPSTLPNALDHHAHALAPVAELPVLEVISATHIIADLTLGLGKVIHDYRAERQS